MSKIKRAHGASVLLLYRVSFRYTASVKALHAKIAEYIGPERKIHLSMFDFLSLKNKAVRMNARKLVNIEKMKMKSSLCKKRNSLAHYFDGLMLKYMSLVNIVDTFDKLHSGKFQ